MKISTRSPILALAVCGALGVSATSATANERTIPILPDGAETPLALGAPGTWTISQTQPLGAGVLVVGHDPQAQRIELSVLGAGKALEQFPSPSTSEKPRDPVAIVDGDRLVAVAWLAGDSARAIVEAARWTTNGWRPTVRLAAPAPGSQLALTGGLAADGQPVLAWSRFDGDDDEIVWSRLEADGWSAPKRVAADNQVPDITPALGRIAGELYLSWSQWDGETYRLHLARLDGESWTPMHTFPEHGAFAPQFEAEGLVTYRDGQNRRWVARELNADGSSRVKSSIEASASRPDTRPRLVVGASESFWWVDGTSTPAEWTGP